MNLLRAGVSTVNITPPVGISMAGFAGRENPSQAIHDDLYARVLILADSTTHLVIITADLISFAPDLVTRIRKAVTDQTRIHGSHVLLNGSHTHSGPTVMAFRCMGNRDSAYEDILCRKVVGAVQMAMANLQPAQVSHGRAPVRIAYNRREKRDGRIVLGHHPSGPEAPWVDVLRFDNASGQPFALFYATASHPVNLSTLSISAEFPGYAAKFIQHNYPAITPLFAQACCGDINCAPKDGTFKGSQALGTRLGAAALTACLDATPICDPTVLQAQTRTLQLDQIKPTVEAAETALIQATSALENARQDQSVTPYLLEQRYKGFYGWAQDHLKMAKREGDMPKQTFEIQTFRIGNVALVAYPGEMFVDYQLTLDQNSPFDKTITLGYNNGCIGYVPTADAYPEGGYEIEQAFKYYGTLMITPHCEDQIKTTTLDLLKKLKLDTL
jgi:neutral ceramidase